MFVLSDLDIGMNDWMCPEFEWDDTYVPDRGKVLHSEDLDKIEKFHRYMDVDGDGITYRTLPGEDARGAYFTRGSGHNKFGGYTEDSAEYQEVLDRLLVKWDTARTLVPAADIEYSRFNETAVLTVGACDGAVKEAIELLREDNIKLNLCRVRGFPFGEEVKNFVAQHKRIYVVEQNRDAQLRSMLIEDIDADTAKLIPALFYDGMPLCAEQPPSRATPPTSRPRSLRSTNEPGGSSPPVAVTERSPSSPRSRRPVGTPPNPSRRTPNASCRRCGRWIETSHTRATIRPSHGSGRSPVTATPSHAGTPPTATPTGRLDGPGWSRC